MKVRCPCVALYHVNVVEPAQYETYQGSLEDDLHHHQSRYHHHLLVPEMGCLRYQKDTRKRHESRVHKRCRILATFHSETLTLQFDYQTEIVVGT